MGWLSISGSTGIAALAALLLNGAGPVLSNEIPAAKDQSRVAAVSVQTDRPAESQAGSTRIAALRFADCLAILAEVSEEASEKPVNLLNTADLRIARIAAADGVVTVTCDRVAGRMSVTRGPVAASSTVLAAR
jgi:hypothetical protein